MHVYGLEESGMQGIPKEFPSEFNEKQANKANLTNSNSVRKIMMSIPKYQIMARRPMTN